MSLLLLSMLKAVFIFGSAIALAAAARRRSAAVRHLIWASALFASLLIPFAPAVESVNVPVQVSSDAPIWLTPVIETPSSSFKETQVVSDSTKEMVPFSATELVLPLWLGGIALSLSTLVFGLANAVRFVSKSRPVVLPFSFMDRVRASDEVSVPIAIWIGRGYIVLPTSWIEWPENRLRNVLLHESAHLRRADPGWLIVGRLACAVHWFNPLAWWALSKMRAEAELAADDAVLSTGVLASSYAEDLIALSKTLRTSALGVPLVRPAGLAQRVKVLVQEGISRSSVNRRLAMSLGILGVAVLTPFASMRLVSEAEEQGSFGSVGVRSIVTEATSSNGTRVRYIGATDGKKAWDSMGKPTKIPPHRLELRSPSPKAVLLVFSVNGRSRIKDEELDAVVQAKAGVSPDFRQTWYVDNPDGKREMLTGQWVVPNENVGAIDVDVLLNDDPWQELTLDKDMKGSGPLRINDISNEPAVEKYDRNGPKNFISIIAPKYREGKTVRVRLTNKDGKRVNFRTLSMAPDRWVLNTFTPFARIGSIAIDLRRGEVLSFSGIALHPQPKR